MTPSIWCIGRDRYYIIKGENLIRQQRILSDMIKDVEVNHMSTEDVVDRIKAAKDCIPDAPPQAF